MKVLLLTSDYHISANIGIKSFLEHPGLKKNHIEVVGILMADQFRLDEEHIKRTTYYFKRLNFLFLIKNILTNIWKKLKIFTARYVLPLQKREYYGIDELAEIYGIPFLGVSSVNSREAQDFIKKKKPDLLVSCFLLEIVKKEVLEMAKMGGINVHPALLQQHRGIFTSFWAIARNWKRSGATIHYMTENVDEGDVILQKHFFVYPSDTIHSINEKSAILGGKLLVKALINLKKGRGKRYRLKRLGQLFSLPTSTDIEGFNAKKGGVISWKDFFRL